MAPGSPRGGGVGVRGGAQFKPKSAVKCSSSSVGKFTRVVRSVLKPSSSNVSTKPFGTSPMLTSYKPCVRPLKM